MCKIKEAYNSFKKKIQKKKKKRLVEQKIRLHEIRWNCCIPDFYLPDHDIYIEVKGYWTDAARHKMKSVQERNPVKIIILESLESIGKFII